MIYDDMSMIQDKIFTSLDPYTPPDDHDELE